MKTYEHIYLILSQTPDFVNGEELASQLKISRTAIWKAIQTLESKGLVIESVKNRGYRLLSGDLLVADWIADQLGIPVSLNPKSASTQLDAKIGIQNQDSTPHLYLAPNQTQAQGRFGRSFYAEENGGIYMSLRLSPQLPSQDLPAYTLMAASALVKAISSLTDKEPRIKWVNDIYLGQKKIAGILTEAISSVETGLVSDVIIGIGLNFAIKDFPEELADKAGSLFTERPSISRQALITKIWQIFFDTDPADLIKVYKDFSLVLGRKVSFSQQNQIQQGLVESISDQGSLLVRLDSGQVQEISSGEVSLISW